MTLRMLLKFQGHWVRRSVMTVIFYALAPGQSAAQIPETFENLQYFPDDISRDSLVNVMRGFSFALGVRCQFCHVGGDGVSFEGVVFHEDSDAKRNARFMLRMVDSLNQQVLTQLPVRDPVPVRIECKTCHRGLNKPLLLTQDLQRVLDTAGIDAAVARYQLLREQAPMAGAFDFGEWETNVMAERLARDGKPREAIAIYEMNAVYYPESISIAFSLGGLYERVDETDRAIGYYERVLELRPEHSVALERLEALRR